ncbi:MAG: Uma2 family endonuclease [Pyrinomonadaceae bacterium]
MNPVLERTKIQPAIEQRVANGEPQPVRWTRNEYYRMAELGFFDGKRVELIGGEIIEMSPMKTAPATAVRLVIEVLRGVFAKGFIVDSQLPMNFGKTDEPEPDVAIVEGKTRDFAESHPKIAALIIEISDTTLNYERNRKASLYAKNKIQDYWIVNLKDRHLEIYRRPMKDKNAFYNFSYGEIQILTEKDSVAPLIKPDAEIKVADLLP